MENAAPSTPTPTPSTPPQRPSQPKHTPTTKKHTNATKDNGLSALNSPTNEIGHELYHKKSISRRHINERLRDLDRTGKACRKWEETRIQVKSLLGVDTWNYRAYRPLSERAFRKSKDQGEARNGDGVNPVWVGASGLGHEEEEMVPNVTKDKGKVNPNETAYDRAENME